MSNSDVTVARLKRVSVLWFWAIFTLFFTRGFLFSTWTAQGPALRDELNLDLVGMGFYAACLSFGSVTGVLISERIVEKIGSRKYSILSYSIMASALMLLGLNLSWEISPLSYVITVMLGLPLGMADYVNHLEAANLNREAAKNKVPLLSGGFSIGVMLGSAMVGVAITAGLGITPDFIAVGAVMLALSLIATLFIAKDNGKALHLLDPEKPKSKITMKAILAEKRSRQIALIAFAFVFAEGTGVVWIPITLVQQGFSVADAAFGVTLFGLGFVVVRLVGGPIADRIGRQKTVFYSAVLASAGVLIFVLTPILGIPLLGALLWGLGNSIGLSMCVAALGDDALRVAARMSFLWTVVYITNILVGPTIGLLSGIGGLLLAFLAPVIFLVVAAFVSHSVDEEHPESATSTASSN